MRHDLRIAVRSLGRRPGFTSVAVLTLGLGIGAATAVFTLLDGVLLSPLPFDEPDALVSLRHQGREGRDALPISPGLYRIYRDQAETLGAVAMHAGTVRNLVVDGDAERVAGRSVTPSFFTVLRVSPALGRPFTEDEGRPGAESVVILSDGLWTTRFGADPAIVGRTVDLDGVSHQVVGVMPSSFSFPERTDRFWVPLVVDEANAPIALFFPDGIARIAPGETLANVRAELANMMPRLPELAPGDNDAGFLLNVGLQARVAPLRDALVGDISATLWLLFGMVGIVLVIACANVANLLLVRLDGRQRELALRVALGAGRLQVLRSLMSEGLVLAAAGGIVGVAASVVAVRMTLGLVPVDLPRMAEIGVDARVLAFAAVAAIASALVFGLFPLARHGLADFGVELRDGAMHGATTGRQRHRLRHALVVAQVALALVLLVGSGLMLRSFVALRAVDPGFNPDQVLTARLSIPSAEVPDALVVDQLYTDLRDRLLARPDVTNVGFVTAVPLGGGGVAYTDIGVEDHPRGENELPIFAQRPQAGPGYFAALGIPVLQGRTFEPSDRPGGVRAVVISQDFADQWWPGATPIGRRVRLGPPTEPWYDVVGVVDNVRQDQLESVAQEMVYFPLLRDPGGDPSIARTVDIVIRTTGDPIRLVPALRQQVRELNPRIPLASPRSMTAIVNEAMARTSFTAALLGAASGVALILGLVGLYGAVSYIVAQRTREIGVRMALGASATAILGMVVRHGLALAGAGIGLGIVVATFLSGSLGTLLYGVEAIDPITYGAVAVSLLVVAVLASLIPALRAASVDPSRALRAE